MAPVFCRWTAIRDPHHLIIIFAVSFTTVSLMTVVVSSTTSRESEFIFSFPTNQLTSPGDDDSQLSLSITAVQDGLTDVRITVVRANWTKALTLPAKHVAVTVELPAGAEATGSRLQDSTVLVTANQEVTVLALSNKRSSVGGFLVRPTHSLGLEYVIVSYTPTVGDWSEFTITATEDDTQVQVPLNAPVLFDNVPYGRQVVQLNMSRLQTAQFQSALDLTGSRILASRPVSVVSGSSSSNIPPEAAAPDYLVEHLPPVGSLGNEYVLSPVLGRSSGYKCVVVAGCPRTMIRGFGDRVILQSAGDSHEWDVVGDSLGVIVSSMPVLVAQFTKGHEADETPGQGSGIGGPSMVIISPIDLYMYASQDALLSTPVLPSGDYHISITVRCDETGGLTLNNSPLIADREFEHTELDGICTVQKLHQPADGNQLLSVNRSASAGVPFAVSVVVQGDGMTGAYALSGNLGPGVSPCEAFGTEGCCSIEDTSVLVSHSYDEEGSLSSSDYSSVPYVMVQVKALRDSVTSDGPTSQRPATEQNIGATAGVTTTASSSQITTSETTTANAASHQPSTGNNVTSSKANTEPSASEAITLSPDQLDNSASIPATPRITTVISRTQTAARTAEINSAVQPETVAGTEQSVAATSVPVSRGVTTAGRSRTTWTASTSASTTTKADGTPPPASTTSVASTLSTLMTRMSTFVSKRQTDITVKICTRCETPTRILLYGSVAMTTLILLSIFICLLKIIQKRHNAKVKQQTPSRWVAYPVPVGLSSEELSLGRLKLKHPVIDEPAPVAPDQPGESVTCNIFAENVTGGTTADAAVAPGSEPDAAGKEQEAGLVQVSV